VPSDACQVPTVNCLLGEVGSARYTRVMSIFFVLCLIAEATVRDEWTQLSVRMAISLNSTGPTRTPTRSCSRRGRPTVAVRHGRPRRLPREDRKSARKSVSVSLSVSIPWSLSYTSHQRARLYNKAISVYTPDRFDVERT